MGYIYAYRCIMSAEKSSCGIRNKKEKGVIFADEVSQLSSICKKAFVY